MQKIYFHSADRFFRFNSKTPLKSFIQRLFLLEKQKLESLHYIFCSDDYLLQINKDFLQHDYYTDIITFNLSDHSKEIEGEVYISIDRVKENAHLQKSGYKEECLRVIFHGALHLCGYRDKTKKEISCMREKENEYLRLYLKSNPN
jgi:rRNA maturation RNase YbeY